MNMQDANQAQARRRAPAGWLHIILAIIATAALLVAALFSASALVGHAQEVTPLQLPAGVALFFTNNLTATATSPVVTPMEQALLDALNSATTSIDAAIYDFDRDSIRDALLAADARGVTVRIVGDDDARVSEKSHAHFEALEAAGIPTIYDGPISVAAARSRLSAALATSDFDPAAIAEIDTSRIMHDKYFIIDSQRVWMGSVNMSDTGLTLNHNHGLLFDSAALAAIYQADFDQMFGGVFGNKKTEGLTTTLEIAGMQTQVAFAPQDDPIQAIVNQIDAAQESVDFAIFFFTNDDVRDALFAHTERGVHIRGLWDNLGSKDGSSDDEALCDAGVAIKIENTRGIMHHKMMVIDALGSDPRVVAGSLNWTSGGNTYNNENTLILHNTAVAHDFVATFQAMWSGINVEPCNPEGVTTYLSFLPLISGPRSEIPPAPTTTPVATPTPQSTPIPNGALEITRIVYDPVGADLDGERVVVANRQPAVIPLVGWTLRDDATNANVFAFPDVQIAASAEITIWVKSGVDTTTELFWGRNQAVWNNDGDVATLRDSGGQTIDACAYEGGVGETDCQ